MNVDVIEDALLNEALLNLLVQQRKERFIISASIHQADLVTQCVELKQSDGLEELIESADTSGERDDCGGCVEHDVLPFRHVLRDDHGANAVSTEFTWEQSFGNDSDDAAAVIERGLGCLAHDADSAAAIHKRATTLADRSADRRGIIEVVGLVAGAGAAKHENAVIDWLVLVGFWVLGGVVQDGADALANDALNLGESLDAFRDNDLVSADVDGFSGGNKVACGEARDDAAALKVVTLGVTAEPLAEGLERAGEFVDFLMVSLRAEALHDADGLGVVAGAEDFVRHGVWFDGGIVADGVDSFEGVEEAVDHRLGCEFDGDTKSVNHFFI